MTTHMALESYLSLTISDDKIIAYLQFLKYDESFSCTTQELEEFLNSHQVKYGLQYETLSKIAANPAEFMHGKTPVAFGISPVNGENGTIELMVDSQEHIQRPLETSDGKVDLKEVNRLNNVRKGQLIAKRIPATPGQEGISVMNDPIPCRAGKEAFFKVGKNVVLNAEQTLMYASIDGLITPTDKGKINIFPVYEVNGDVDYRTGNIDFVGTVVIRGNVLTGFRVKASGDIRVIGGVEGAEMEAEGSIDISGGIIGYNKGFVRAAKNVKSSFIQDGNVIAGEDVIVLQSIMHSNIRAGMNVTCKGPKGLIVGGNIQAGDKVTARTIGNTMSTVTVVEVGVVPELRNELSELRTQLKELIDQKDKTDKALHLLNQLASSGQLAPDKLALRIKLNATQKSHTREMTTIKERILEIEKSLESTIRSRVEVVSRIYGGSKIVIGRNTLFVKDAMDRVVFYYDDGEIVKRPY